MELMVVADWHTYPLREPPVMVYIDPPFGTGSRPYQSATEQEIVDVALEWLARSVGTVWLHLSPKNAHRIAAAVEEASGIAPAQQLVWEFAWVSGFKSRARKFPETHHLIFAFEKRTAKHHPAADPHGVRLGTVIKGLWSPECTSFVNSWRYSEKPVALLELLIRHSTDPGDLVADPCCGSGATAVAARRLGRQFYVSDIDRDAVLVTAARLAGARRPKRRRGA